MGTRFAESVVKTVKYKLYYTVKYNKPLSYTYRSMKIFSTEEFLENLHVQYREKRVTETESINDAFKAFIDVLRHTLNKHAPIKKATHKILKLQTKPWLTKGILISIKVKNELFAYTKKNPSNSFCIITIKSIETS